MAQTPTLENPSALTERSPIKVIALSVVTFMLYGLYWLYQVNQELEEATSAEYDPLVRTLLAFVIVGVWQTATTAEAVTDQSALVLFLAWLFPPIMMYLVITGMNDAAA